MGYALESLHFAEIGDRPDRTGQYVAHVTDEIALWAQPDPAAATAGPTAFRPVQYLGSKARLLGPILECIDEVDPSGGPVVDLFSGSGVVAAGLARSREVIAVDIQEYARVLASALLSPAHSSDEAAMALASDARRAAREIAESAAAPLVSLEGAAEQALAHGDPSLFCHVLEAGSVAAFELGQTPPDKRVRQALADASAALRGVKDRLTLTRFYGGVYFGYGQALQLDCLLELVYDLAPGSTRDTRLAAVLGAASEAVTSVGSHFAQPIRPRDKHGRPKLRALLGAARRRRRDAIELFSQRLGRYSELPGANHAARAVTGDYRAFLASAPPGVGVVYADPPYTRDHYSRFYHVLETMARGDLPEISTVAVNGEIALSRGLYRQDRHQSPFCIRSEVRDAFRELFIGVRRLEAPLVLSYSPYSSGTAARPQPRLMTIPEIVELAAETFDAVEVRSPGAVAHSKFNSERVNGVAEQEAETLIVCSP
jgi:adenine-specific DNA-methyltransferase